MNLDWLKYYDDDYIDGKQVWEVIAKSNSPSFKNDKRFFFAPFSLKMKNNMTIGGCLVPVDTKKGYEECLHSNKGTPIPFELVDAWIETHPNQRFYNNELLKEVIAQGYVSDEYFAELKERNLIVEIPEGNDYRNKMF